MFVSVLLSPPLFMSNDSICSISTHIYNKTSSAVPQLDESSFCFSYLRAKQFKRNKERAITNCIDNKLTRLSQNKRL